MSKKQSKVYKKSILPPYMESEDIQPYIEEMCKELGELAEIAGLEAIAVALHAAEKLAKLEPKNGPNK